MLAWNPGQVYPLRGSQHPWDISAQNKGCTVQPGVNGTIQSFLNGLDNVSNNRWLKQWLTNHGKQTRTEVYAQKQAHFAAPPVPRWNSFFPSHSESNRRRSSPPSLACDCHLCTVRLGGQYEHIVSCVTYRRIHTSRIKEPQHQCRSVVWEPGIARETRRREERSVLAHP